jgi:DNA polymerase iota
MIETASDDGKGGGRDIGRLFKKQEEVLKHWKFEDKDVPPDPIPEPIHEAHDAILTDPSAGNEVADNIIAGSEDVIFTQNSAEEPAEWDDEEDEDENREICHECGATMPAFAMAAHERFHSLET